MSEPSSLSSRFGEFGGRYAAETLMQPLLDLEQAYLQAKADPRFAMELEILRRDFIGRETPLLFAERLSNELGGAQIYLKREDLAHTGAHKINNSVGQILLAKRMGKTRIIAETGAGQHGVATAAVAAKFGLQCVVYMGAEDMRRQAPNVKRMQLFGAEVRPVHSGTQTLKDAVSESMRDWITNVKTSYYLLGSALGPHPYPTIVRDFQSIIGLEARRQILDQAGRLPEELIACVGGGSNAIGLFYPFLTDEKTRLTGVEAGGLGIHTNQHAARFQGGRRGIFQGTETFVLQDQDGQVLPTHSISAGLDYAAVGPEHSFLSSTGRANYVSATDEEALAAFHELCRTEGILPALESSHAVAYAIRVAPHRGKEEILIVNLSGRGDKDLDHVLRQTAAPQNKRSH